MSQTELEDHVATGHGMHTFTPQDIFDGATKDDWEEAVDPFTAAPNFCDMELEPCHYDGRQAYPCRNR
jgi:hypothetical protein